jgi:cadmium resistance protein CadD (predicted permease)
MPLGIALLGVIPLAVGLAYLVFYFTDDSRKRLAAEAGNPTAPTP